jgi:hypothetical protein
MNHLPLLRTFASESLAGEHLTVEQAARVMVLKKGESFHPCVT